MTTQEKFIKTLTTMFIVSSILLVLVIFCSTVFNRPIRKSIQDPNIEYLYNRTVIKIQGNFARANKYKILDEIDKKKYNIQEVIESPDLDDPMLLEGLIVIATLKEPNEPNSLNPPENTAKY